MSTEVMIGGQPRTIGDFNAFKAIEMLRLVSDVEGAFREVLKTGASFKREYIADNEVEFDRAEARRQFRARVLTQETQRPRLTEGGEAVLADDGTPILDVEYAPVLNDRQEPVMGPDPLGHLTEADWAASGHKLRVPDPAVEGRSAELSMAAMIPPAFRLARVQVLRVLALALTSNSDLEKWDEEGVSIDTALDGEATKLIHRAGVGELISMGVAVAKLCRDQVADPFAKAKAAYREWQTPAQTETPTVASATFETPAQLPTTPSPTSSISSPAGTGGTSERSSTEPAGVS